MKNEKIKKVARVICCAIGSGMIGFFADSLNTVIGAVCFTFGVALLVSSIASMPKQDGDNKQEK